MVWLDAGGEEGAPPTDAAWEWKDEAPCGVPELRVTQASVSKRQLERGIKGWRV